MPLKIFQTAAVLEIFHSMFGLVRSPLVTTFVQVGSRLILLWSIVEAQADPSPHNHPRLAGMVMAW